MIPETDSAMLKNCIIDVKNLEIGNVGITGDQLTVEPQRWRGGEKEPLKWIH